MNELRGIRKKEMKRDIAVNLVVMMNRYMKMAIGTQSNLKYALCTEKTTLKIRIEKGEDSWYMSVLTAS